MQTSQPSDAVFKRYLRGSVLLFVIFMVLLSAYIRVAPMRYMNVEYPMWAYTRETMNSTLERPPRLLVLGDSRAQAGFDPALVDDDTLNLALGGTTALESYYTLRNYLRHNPPPEALVISIAPLHLTKMDSFWARTVRSFFLEQRDYAEIFALSKEIRSKTLGSTPWLTFIENRLPFAYFSDLVSGEFALREEQNRAVYDYVTEHRGHHHFGTMNGASAPNQEAGRGRPFKPAPYLTHYLEQLFQLAAEHDIPTFWYTMPFNEGSCATLIAGYRQAYDAFVTELAAPYGVDILEPFNCRPDALFGDPSHLYGEGVVQETRKLYERVSAKAFSR